MNTLLTMVFFGLFLCVISFIFFKILKINLFKTNKDVSDVIDKLKKRYDSIVTKNNFTDD